MNTGTIISGAAHLGLIGWVLFGGMFSTRPQPFEVREVSVISAEEYAALTVTRAPPDVTEEPGTLSQPDPVAEPPEIQPPSDGEPEKVPPGAVARPEQDVVPDALPDQPAPDADVTDTAPVLELPDQQETALVPQPPAPSRPADRVAPVPVAPPPPDVRPDEVANPQVSPDEGAEEPQEPQEATAPEAAADRIVTEADEVSDLAPARSARPQARRAPRPAEKPAEKPPVRAADQPAPDTGAAVNSALAEALGGGEPTAPVTRGPPLSAGEKDALRVAVQDCWVVDVGSPASRVTVTIAMRMTPEGRVEQGSLRMIASEGGEGRAVEVAFQAARRAVLRCQVRGRSGYELPPEKYDQWREIEMKFNPERMRIK